MVSGLRAAVIGMACGGLTRASDMLIVDDEPTASLADLKRIMDAKEKRDRKNAKRLRDTSQDLEA